MKEIQTIGKVIHFDKRKNMQSNQTLRLLLNHHARTADRFLLSGQPAQLGGEETQPYGLLMGKFLFCRLAAVLSPKN